MDRQKTLNSLNSLSTLFPLKDTRRSLELKDFNEGLENLLMRIHNLLVLCCDLCASSLVSPIFSRFREGRTLQ